MKRNRIAAALAAVATTAGLSLAGAAVVAQPAGAITSALNYNAFIPTLYCMTHSQSATLTQSYGGVATNGLPITNLTYSGSCWSASPAVLSVKFVDKVTKSLLTSSSFTVNLDNQGSFYQSQKILFANPNNGVCMIFTDSVTQASVTAC